MGACNGQRVRRAKKKNATRLLGCRRISGLRGKIDPAQRFFGTIPKQMIANPHYSPEPKGPAVAQVRGTGYLDTFAIRHAYAALAALTASTELGTSKAGFRYGDRFRQARIEISGRGVCPW
jgi:hypothetical protein